MLVTNAHGEQTCVTAGATGGAHTGPVAGDPVVELTTSAGVYHARTVPLPAHAMLYVAEHGRDADKPIQSLDYWGGVHFFKPQQRKNAAAARAAEGGSTSERRVDGGRQYRKTHHGTAADNATARAEPPESAGQ